MTGTIKKLVRERKFGFIQSADTGKDVFFHSEDLAGVDYDSLNEGDSISFETADSEKGPKAVNVQKV